MSCTICKQEQTHVVTQIYDDRFGFPGKFTLMSCSECCHVFLQNEFTPEQLTDLYSNYYPRSEFCLESHKPYQPESGFLAWLDGKRSSAFRWVPKNVRVLDIGCGFGESLGYHIARGCEVYGVEADENIRRVAEKFGYRVHVGLFDPDRYEQNFFDYVTMDQVMEHMTDPVETLRGVARVLKPGGEAILTTPNVNGWGASVFGRKWINWHAPYHLQFYSRESIRILAEKADLKIKSVQTITASAWLHYQWLHLLTCPEPGQPSSFWAGSACVKASDFALRAKIIMRIADLINRAKVNHLVTRFFDTLGIGDSYVFVMCLRN